MKPRIVISDSGHNGRQVDSPLKLVREDTKLDEADLGRGYSAPSDGSSRARVVRVAVAEMVTRVQG